MKINSVARLVQTLHECQLLEPAQCNVLVTELQQRFPNPKALVQELLRRDWLTAFQVQQLSNGHAGELVFGRYVVLDLLGEGGMGRVYKARHRGMKRLVALKVIRRDMVSDAETVGRFYREMKLASQLLHPNIVRAYDAGPVGATHFLALEYVEGIDLDRQVRQSGPLTVAEACEYIRQAACGLAHAYEKGLVHRDINHRTCSYLGPDPRGMGLDKSRFLIWAWLA